MKKVIVGIVCLLLSGCGEDQEITAFKNKYLEGFDKNKTIRSLLFNRPYCSETSLTKESELFVYSCDLNNYENIVREIIVKRFTDVEKENKALINKYKEEIDVAAFKLERLAKIEAVFNELKEEGIIDKYNGILNDFRDRFNKIDPTEITENNTPVLDNLDYSLALDRKLVINYIKNIVIKYGVTEEFGKYVDLLETSKENRNRVINKEGEEIYNYIKLAKEEIKNISESTNKKLDVLAKFTYTPYIKKISHKANFIVNEENVKIDHCEISYTTFDDVTHSTVADGFCKDIFYNDDVYKNDLPKLLNIFVDTSLKEKNY